MVPNCWQNMRTVGNGNERRRQKKRKDIPLVHLQQLLLPWSVLVCPNCMKPICSRETPRYGEGLMHTDGLAVKRWKSRLLFRDNTHHIVSDSASFPIKINFKHIKKQSELHKH